MKILNLYAGIGGNRKSWGSEHDITAIEFDPAIADIYRQLYPLDTVLETDALQYLLDNRLEYDFIWASPPCQTHSRLRNSQRAHPSHKRKKADLSLYQVILALKQYYSESKWVVENVDPWYPEFIPRTAKIDKAVLWSNFPIDSTPFFKKPRNIAYMTFDELITHHDMQDQRDVLNTIKKGRKHPEQILRNAVLPHIGLRVFQAAFSNTSLSEHFLPE